MNFYHAYYKRQIYDEDIGTWIDTYYTFQGIIVIADSYDSALRKVGECLTKVETGKYRAVLVSDVVECIGPAQWVLSITVVPQRARGRSTSQAG